MMISLLSYGECEQRMLKSAPDSSICCNHRQAKYFRYKCMVVANDVQGISERTLFLFKGIHWETAADHPITRHFVQVHHHVHDICTVS